VTFAGGSSHTVFLTIITGSCFMQFSKSYTVGPCPGTTTSTTTTTTSTTTRPPGPTTSTTTTSTSTTQPPGPTTSITTTTTTSSSTTSRPPSGRGCLCILLLVLALALIGLAAIAFMSWACAGFISPTALLIATTAAGLGLVLLVIWILMPMSYPATFLGFLLFVVNLPFALMAFGMGAVRLDLSTGTVETTGGVVGITDFVGGGFNLGNFTFLSPGPGVRAGHPDAVRRARPSPTVQKSPGESPTARARIAPSGGSVKRSSEAVRG
jgi:hypothetical protein